MGCENAQFSQDSTAGLSKECQLIEKMRECLVKTKDEDGCSFTIVAIALIGTRHDELLNKVLSGEIKDSEVFDQEIEASLSNKERLIFREKLYEEVGYLLEKTTNKSDSEGNLILLIELSKKYSCPEPK